MTWEYPIEVPRVAGDLEPVVALSYSSDGVDGRAASTNNQPSWVGEGFDYSPGYVERTYSACADDMGAGANNSVKTGDLCWGKTTGRSDDRPWEHLTMAGPAGSGELVRVGNTNSYRFRSDNGTRIERLTGGWNGASEGEYFKVTSAEGSQYFYGLGRANASAASTGSAWTVPVHGNHVGEPGYVAGNFVASAQTRVWRWNLDHVVSAHGEAVTYYYTTESNRYNANLKTSTAYVRGGYLNKIEYGQRNGSEHTSSAAARVLFTVAERCVVDTTFSNCAETNLSATTAAHWPDVPFDQVCVSTTTCSATQSAPTFFTRKRLAQINTQVLDAGGAYLPVDEYALTAAFPDPGDGTTAALWLAKITHTGQAGATPITTEPVTFYGTALPNRVDGLDVAPPLNRYRISSIANGTGGSSTFSYSGPDCTPGNTPAPDANNRRCFPAFYTPPGGTTPVLHWFHKYVVTQAGQFPSSNAPATVTSYSYVGAAWHYDDSPVTADKYRTWGQWRGFNSVTTTVGDSAIARHQSVQTYYQGMDGDRLSGGGTRSATVTDSTGITVPDYSRAAGMVREARVLNGVGGAVLSSTINTPWISAPTATDGYRTASMAATDGTTKTRTTRADGTIRTVASSQAFDVQGREVSQHDAGDSALTQDDRCTRTSYTAASAWFPLGLPSELQTTTGDCSAPPTTESTLSWQRTYYDGSTSTSAAPTVGDQTKTEALTDTPTGRAFGVESIVGFDQFGRVTTSSDSKGRVTTTVYAPQGPLPTTTTVTGPDPDGPGPLSAHSTTSVVDPRRATLTKVTRADGVTVQASADALGRVTSAWTVGVTSSTTPDVRYSYTLRPAGPNAVSTARLLPNGQYSTSISLFDGLMRPVQTQEPAANQGRIVTETLYDSAGQSSLARSQIWDSSSEPTTGLVTTSDADAPSVTRTVYDGAGRTTSVIDYGYGVELRRTTTAYPGVDQTTTTPSEGASPTRSTTDADGHLISLTRYHGSSATGPGMTTSYTYTPAGLLSTVRDGAGATANTWTNVYDLSGRRIQASDPDTGTTRWTYDSDDSILSVTNAKGQQVKYAYDQLGRKTAATDAAGTPRATWTYDTVRKGYLTSASRIINGRAITTSTDSYDSAGRATKTTTTVPAIEGVVEPALAGTWSRTHQYQVNGAYKGSVVPAMGPLPAETLWQQYQPRTGLPASLTSQGRQAIVASTTRNPYGQALQYAQGLANQELWDTRTYDGATSRLTSVQLDRATRATFDRRHTYRYDATGNVTSLRTDMGGAAAGSASWLETQCYGYDGQQRLTDAWTPGSDDCAGAPTASGLAPGAGSYWTSWSFDASGNRATQTRRVPGAADQSTTYSYPGAGQPHPHFATQVSTDSSAADYAVDEVGNTVSRPDGRGGVQTLGWDVDGSLATVSDAGGAVVQQSWTGPDGDRLVRRTATQTTLYLGDTELTLTRSSGAVTGLRSYEFDGQTVATRTGVGPETVNMVFADRQGSATATVRTSDSEVTIRQLDPYGGRRGADLAWPTQRGFVGGINDDATGLTHLGAREYDSGLGAFISADPLIDLTDATQMGGYAYSSHNPVTYADPTGLMHDVASESVPAPKAKAASKNKSGGGGGGGAKSLHNAFKKYIQAVWDADPHWRVLSAAGRVAAFARHRAHQRLQALSRPRTHPVRAPSATGASCGQTNWGTGRCLDSDVVFDITPEEVEERRTVMVAVVKSLVGIDDAEGCLVDRALGTCALSAGSITFKAIKALKWLKRGTDTLQDAAKTVPELASKMERTGSALNKSDPFHRSVSWVVENPAAKRFTIRGGDGVGRDLYQLPGEVNGKSGVFEWIIDRSGGKPVINHQRFIPGGSVTGVPNQVVP